MRSRRVLLSVCLSVWSAAGCSGDELATGAGTGGGGSTTGGGGSTTGAVPTGGADATSGETGVPLCDPACHGVDLLIVIDNSESMAEEQARLVAGVPALVDGLRGMVDRWGWLVNPDVNIMVTTTDMGHPLCGGHPAGYEPARGAPTVTACTDRLANFSASAMCTDSCPEGQVMVPGDPFVHFVPGEDNGDAVVAALGCIVPQGVVGCGMESPLEAMLQALAPEQPWNQGERPFLRDGAALAIVVLSDESDCSVDIGGYPYFDPKNVDDPAFNQYWADVPGMPGVKQEPTSAICWSAGMSCAAGDEPGVYADCVPAEKGVLRPLARYTDFLAALAERRPVVMLALTGVPLVTGHQVEAPYEPTQGGLLDLVYHDWGAADLLVGGVATPAELQHEYGIGPGCIAEPGTQGLPPGRIQRVCESLNVAEDPDTHAGAVRCHIESICEDDYGTVLKILAYSLGLVLPTGKTIAPG